MPKRFLLAFQHYIELSSCQETTSWMFVCFLSQDSSFCGLHKMQFFTLVFLLHAFSRLKAQLVSESLTFPFILQNYSFTKKEIKENVTL